MALMPWCLAARNGLVRLVGRMPVGMGALSDTAALADRGTSALQRSDACSASTTQCTASHTTAAGKLPPTHSASWHALANGCKRLHVYAACSYHACPSSVQWPTSASVCTSLQHAAITRATQPCPYGPSARGVVSLMLSVQTDASGAQREMRRPWRLRMVVNARCPRCHGPRRRAGRVPCIMDACRTRESFVSLGRIDLRSTLVMACTRTLFSPRRFFHAFRYTSHEGRGC